MSERPRSRFARRVVAALVALALAAGAAWWWQRRAERAARLAALEADVTAVLAAAVQGPLPGGASAAFALPDGRDGVAVAGLADVEAGAPLTPATRFMAGSVGKSFHAALALALHGEGVLDLDAPIARWLGAEPWFERLPNARDLSLRHLLQHRSGLIDHVWSLEFFVKQLKTRLVAEADAVLPPEELIGIALDREPRFPAGQEFAYGDTNYLLAGLVIERAGGRPPFAAIEERFLGPLALEGIVPARERRIPRLAAGYQLPVNPFLLPRKIALDGELHFHPMVESTAGGLASTPRDLVRWAVALFEERALDGPYLEDLVGRSVAASRGRRYGLGVYLYDTPLGEAWGHGGFFPGYRSGLLYWPGERIAVAVQANRDHLLDVDALMHEIAARVAREGD